MFSYFFSPNYFNISDSIFQTMLYNTAILSSKHYNNIKYIKFHPICIMYKFNLVLLEKKHNKTKQLSYTLLQYLFRVKLHLMLRIKLYTYIKLQTPQIIKTFFIKQIKACVNVWCFEKNFQMKKKKITCKRKFLKYH